MHNKPLHAVRLLSARVRFYKNCAAETRALATSETRFSWTTDPAGAVNPHPLPTRSEIRVDRALERCHFDFHVTETKSPRNLPRDSCLKTPLTPTPQPSKTTFSCSHPQSRRSPSSQPYRGLGTPSPPPPPAASSSPTASPLSSAAFVALRCPSHGSYGRDAGGVWNIPSPGGVRERGSICRQCFLGGEEKAGTYIGQLEGAAYSPCKAHGLACGIVDKANNGMSSHRRIMLA